jgi:Ca2+-binding RTX toxin-like protein
MSWFWLNRLLKKKSRPVTRVGRKRLTKRTFTPEMESLSERILPAITATFIPSVGLLTVTGDAQDNAIVVGRDAAGRILINGGAIAVRGGAPTVAGTKTISVFGLAGNDIIMLDETNGALPTAQLFGGDGNDTLTGGSSADLLFGEAGNDTLLGKGGDDLLFGGAGNDTLTGGVGNDQIFGQAGDDRMIWNPGEGSDVNEGGDGVDTVEVEGGNGAETFTATANGTRVRFDRTIPAPFTLDIGTTENLVVNMNGGDDVFTAGNGLAPLIAINVDGGAGNDNITGGDGNDTLSGGDGNDTIVGGRGNDTVFMGAGDDTFVWNPGDGSDTVEGQQGADTMIFNGANVNEKINVSANGPRVLFTRDVAAIAMDLNQIENINFNALGGADNIVVGDLSGTGVQQVNIDLSATPGSNTGDAQPDTVVVSGSNGNDQAHLQGNASSFTVTGLPAQVSVTGSEGANDSLTVNLLGGNDSFDLPGGSVGAIKQLTVDGGAGDDTITGGDGADVLLGGDGDDVITGGRGNDSVLMGAGNDIFVWNPGDGSDTVEGQDGIDSMIFNGANVGENIDISANGSRVRFFRDVANITMDLNGIETVDFNALGGADTITVNDLTGTDLTTVNLNLAATPGDPTGDGQADAVIVNGTNGNDTIHVASFDNDSRVAVGGTLSVLVNITGAEGANDKLTVNALSGDDIVDASNLSANLIGLTLNGGAGNDFIEGSQGNDLVSGGTGTDTAMLGAGDDTFVWNPGDGSDTVEGQGGQDTLQFNGSNVGENIDLSANGSRVRLFRDVGNVTMDVNGVEQINVVALGGADNLTINDLTGTDVTTVNIDLASPPGSGMGDGQADTIIVNGTNAEDAITVAGDATGVSVTGLAAQVNIAGAEAANDKLIVNALGGDDVVEASGLSANAIRFAADGGDGDDVLIGGDGNDTLSGGAGDDVLIGGPGQDVLDGGTGNNILIQ